MSADSLFAAPPPATQALPADLELMPLNAARNLPALKQAGRGGRRPDPATLHRWSTVGVKVGGQRIKLETVRIGGGPRQTNGAAVSRFVMRLNQAGPAPIREADAPRVAHEHAEAELAAAGI